MDDHILPPRRFLFLRRFDQACAAVLVLVCGGLMGFDLIWHGGHRGRLIEIDRSPPQEITFQVDVNLADWPELTLLPGVGESLARRIVESRAREGAFASHQELRRVKGIGPRTLDRLRPYLRPIPRAETIAGP